MQHFSPPLRLQRLGETIRTLRTRRGLTQAELAERLGWSPSKVARAEAGENRISEDDVHAAMVFFGVGQETLEDALLLARQASARPWWAPYKEVLGEYVAHETEADLARSWQPLLVDGLLQTPAYAEAVLAAFRPDELPSLRRARVQARIARQSNLVRPDNPISLSLVIAELAIRAPVGGPEVMRAQLDELIERASWPHITIRVLPLSVGAHPGMDGAFVLLTSPENPPVVFTEGGPDEIVTKEKEVVRRYERRFDMLSATALSPQETITVLEAVRGEM